MCLTHVGYPTHNILVSSDVTNIDINFMKLLGPSFIVVLTVDAHASLQCHH